ncbi:MAG: hypothetical protein WD605_03110, partial [Candidatus Paceibacterota bacterium]
MELETIKENNGVEATPKRYRSSYLIPIVLTAVFLVGGCALYLFSPVEIKDKEASVEVKEISDNDLLEQGSNEIYDNNDGGKKSYALTQHIEESHHIAMKIAPYSDEILNFEITSYREVDDHRLFADYLGFDSATGDIFLKNYSYSDDSKENLLRLSKFEEENELERKLQDLLLTSFELTEQEYTQKIRAGLSEKFSQDLVESIDFRSFCKLLLLSDEDYYQNKTVTLDYDNEKYGEYALYSTNFGTQGPCAVGP